jgi:shikimate kinase
MNSNENKVNADSSDGGFGLIFLTGFMGCGKTTLGKKLASRLGYEFFDLDHILEAQVRMSIAEYFSSFGEDAFRRLESEVLKETKYPQNAIVSTGGGLPCFFDNMQWMNNHGKTIYIKLPSKTLADRLENEKHTRPVLNGAKGKELVSFIEGKLAERDKFYNQAKIVADGLNLTAEKVVQLLNN